MCLRHLPGLLLSEHLLHFSASLSRQICLLSLASLCPHNFGPYLVLASLVLTAPWFCMAGTHCGLCHSPTSGNRGAWMHAWLRVGLRMWWFLTHLISLLSLLCISFCCLVAYVCSELLFTPGLCLLMNCEYCLRSMSYSFFSHWPFSFLSLQFWFLKRENHWQS